MHVLKSACQDPLLMVHNLTTLNHRVLMDL